MTAPLVVKNVEKRFQQGASDVHVLKGIDLTVGSGEFVAIMGASGSGKSTLLHAAAGLTDIDGGEIVVAGQDLAALSDSKLTDFRRRQIGIVFQAFNLIPVLTAEANIRLPLVGSAAADGRVAALLQLMGLEQRRTHRPHALSGGEQQRVAIARALAGNPAILLLDEPTGSLDSVAGQELCKTLRHLCDDEGCTIVMVTHEAGVAMWADRVEALRDGRVVDRFDTDHCKDDMSLAHRYRQAVRADAARQEATSCPVD